MLRARRLPAAVLSLAGVVVIAGLALSTLIVPDNWTDARAAAEQRVAALKEQINEMGGKVLDTASTLAEENVVLATPTPAQIVVLNLPVAQSPAETTRQADIVVAPTTVGEAIGGVALPVTEVAALPPATASPTPAATEAPATATATQPPPTATSVPPTATPVPPTATPLPPTPTPSATPLPPTPTAEAVAAAASAGGSGQTYVVQPGDNWFTVARRFGITQETLAAYNNTTPSAILQVEQRLRIPPAGATVPVPTATPPRPTATPTAARPTSAPPTPTAVVPSIPSLAAPGLISPLSGDGFTAGTQPLLTWKPVIGMTAQDYYYVRVKFAMRDGQDGYLEERVPNPSLTVPVWVYDVAAPPDRLATWSVQVRRAGPDGQEIEVSPPSENRVFYWR